MLRRALYISLFLTICFANVKGQDATFSQFYANKLYLSPSFAGATEQYRLALNYRNQWPSVPGVFHTYSFSYDMAMPSFNSGIGFLATYDVAGSGDLSTMNLGLIYSYDIQINDDWHVRPGVQFKFYTIGLDINKLIFNSMLSGKGTSSSIYPPPFESVKDVDFTASAIVFNDKIWAGITLDHLFTPKNSLYGEDETLPMKTNIFGGVQLYKKTRLRTQIRESVSVALNFQKMGKYYQSDVGLYYLKRPLIFGLWYRGIPFATNQAGDALIALVGIKTDYLHIGYSYDFTISNLISSTGGSHEISLIYEFNNLSLGNQRRRIKAIPCPEF